MGQRYDLIVEANAATSDYWIRAGWITACSTNDNPDDMTGIIRYDSSSTADPTTTSDVTIGSNCGDEPLANLVPYLALNVGDISEVTEESLSFAFSSYFTWTINSSSLYMNWSDPTIIRVYEDQPIWPTTYNVVPLTADSDDEWTVYVIQDLSGIGLTHPIHLHGHDFWVVGQATGQFDIDSSDLNLVNPPRRDVASLPANGYLAIAFKKDNPGSWLMHCHIAWHASQGLAMQFVERESEIGQSMSNVQMSKDNCAAWIDYDTTAVWPQDDSGI
jgi:FtsP/CotA-like multicopper oxidase with cupredoxin domain